MPTILHGQGSRFFEIAPVLVRFNHVASFIVNANDCCVLAGVSLCVPDSASRVVIAASAPERQYI
jgi:hypothetical protein